MSRPVHDIGTGVVEGVDLDVQGQPLDPLLCAEVGREALHSQVHLRWRFQRVPVDGTERNKLLKGKGRKRQLTAHCEIALRCDQPNLL